MALAKGSGSGIQQAAVFHLHRCRGCGVHRPAAVGGSCGKSIRHRFVPLTLAITHNQTVQLIRYNKAEKRDVRATVLLGEFDVPAHSASLSELDLQELRALIESLQKTLSPKAASVLGDFYLKGLTQREIAKRNNLTQFRWRKYNPQFAAHSGDCQEKSYFNERNSSCHAKYRMGRNLHDQMRDELLNLLIKESIGHSMPKALYGLSKFSLKTLH